MADTVLCSRTGTGSGHRSSFRPSTTATKFLGSAKHSKLLHYQTRVISIVEVCLPITHGFVTTRIDRSHRVAVSALVRAERVCIDFQANLIFTEIRSPPRPFPRPHGEA